MRHRKPRGIKRTCGQKRSLGRYMGDSVQVFYDREADEVFGVYHTNAEWSVFHDANIVEVATCHEPATMEQIGKALESALGGE